MTHRKREKGRSTVGGVNINRNSDKSGKHLFQDCHVEYRGQGTYGLVFEMSYENGVGIYDHTMVNEVQQVILKVGLLYEMPKERYVELESAIRAEPGRVFQITQGTRILNEAAGETRILERGEYEGRQREIRDWRTSFLMVDDGLRAVSSQRRIVFNEETETYLKIYNLGIQDGVQICPSLLYAGEKLSTDPELLRIPFFRKALDERRYNPSMEVPMSIVIMEKVFPWIHKRCQECGTHFYRCNFDGKRICSTIVDGRKCVGSGQTASETEVMNSARLLLLYLGTKGCAHGDPSMPNIMKKFGRLNEAMLIDFYIQRIHPRETDFLKSIWERCVKKVGTRFVFDGVISNEESRRIDAALLLGKPAEEMVARREAVDKKEKRLEVRNYEWLKTFQIPPKTALYAGFQKSVSLFEFQKVFESPQQFVDRTHSTDPSEYERTISEQQVRPTRPATQQTQAAQAAQQAAAQAAAQAAQAAQQAAAQAAAQAAQQAAEAAHAQEVEAFRQKTRQTRGKKLMTKLMTKKIRYFKERKTKSAQVDDSDDSDEGEQELHLRPQRQPQPLPPLPPQPPQPPQPPVIDISDDEDFIDVTGDDSDVEIL